MKKVTSADSLVTVHHYRNILTAEGIASFIKNEHLVGIIGEMPFQEAWPQLWVENDLDYDRARQLIDANRLVEESPASPWTCSGCQEVNEGQFGACWSCGTPA